MATSAPHTNAPLRLFVPAGLLLLDANAGESWEEICRSGRYASALLDKGRPARVVNLPPSAMDDMAATFALTEAQGWFPGGPPIDVNHASAYAVDAEATKAYGRIKALEARDNDKGGRSLWALVAWNDEGVTLARNRAFGGFSAEVYEPGEVCDRVTLEPIPRYVLRGATMTNRPAVLGMEPLRGPQAVGQPAALTDVGGAPLYLSDDPPDQEGPKKMAEGPASLLGAVKAFGADPSPETFAAMEAAMAALPAGPQRDGFFAGIADMKAAMGAPAPVAEEHEPMAEPPAEQAKPKEEEKPPGLMALADTQRATLLAERDSWKGAAAEKTAEVKRLQALLAERNEADWKRRLDDMVNDGRILPAQRDTVRGRYDAIAKASGAKEAEMFLDDTYPKGRTGVGQVHGYSGADAANRGADGDATAQVLRLADERSRALAHIPDPVARHREALFQVRRENPHLFAAKEG